MADLRNGGDSTMVFAAVLRPYETNSSSSRAGAYLYTRYCTVCHGSGGDGDGFNSYNLQSSFGVTPTAFTDSTYWNISERGRLEFSIKGDPPNVKKDACLLPWGATLTPQEISDVVVYIQAFRKQREQE